MSLASALKIAAQINPDEATTIETLLGIIPEEAISARITYEKLVGQACEKANPAERTTSLQGIVFELTRAHILLEAGEQLDYRVVDTPITVQFKGYPYKTVLDKNGGVPGASIRNKHMEQIIQPDVPVIRNGKLHVVETKRYTRMKIGMGAAAWNQILKFHQAYEAGLVSGVTCEYSGRVAPGFITWARGLHLPELQIIYSFPLPSGGEYRREIRKATENGLRITNGTPTEEDSRVIAALEAALEEKGGVSKVMHMLNRRNDQINAIKITSNEELQKYQAWWKHNFFSSLLGGS